MSNGKGTTCNHLHLFWPRDLSAPTVRLASMRCSCFGTNAALIARIVVGVRAREANCPDYELSVESLMSPPRARLLAGYPLGLLLR